MKEINDLGKWMFGKTVKTVDAKAVNGIAITFTDDTGCWIESGYHGNGIYGPVVYEIDPSKPIHQQ